jgi:hypothetical protein
MAHTQVYKTALLFKKCVKKLRSNDFFIEVGVNWEGLHCVFQDNRGNTHSVKALHIQETGDVQLWYAGASKTTHLIQMPFKSVKRLTELVTRVYAQENND